MAWKKIEEKEKNEKQLKEIWVSFGKSPKGDVNVKVLHEGESVEGYLEKITKSPKYSQPIVSLILEDVRYLMFAPKDLEKKIDGLLEEVDGKMVYTRITFKGVRELENDKKLYMFEVEYDDENTLEE